MSEEPSDAADSAPPPHPGPAVPAVASPSELPSAAGDTRSRHLRAILAGPWTLSLTFAGVAAAFVVGTTQAGAGVGAAAGAGIALLALLIAFVIASGRAREDFFSHYASARGLARTAARGSLPPSTPLLRRGDRRYAEQIMNGTLASGLPGAIALYTYEVTRRDSDGNRDTDHYRFTVVMHDLPALAEKVSQIFCERRSGFRWMDSAEDVFRRSQRLRLESHDLDKRYEIFFGANDDPNWMRRLFSPKFIVWLCEEAPGGLAFELQAGSLCVNVKGHHDSAAELDELAAAAGAIARRLAEEAAE